MPEQLEEPVYRILLAQQANIARITEGLVLEGTSGDGREIELWGPAPNLIRLYDKPIRFIERPVLENWERIITLAPVNDNDAGRFASRDDRSVTYQVNFLVRLTDSEQREDREALTQTPTAPISVGLLAPKAHRLLYDWHHVFFDNHHLITSDCPQGLVDDASYGVEWEPTVEYPYSLFTAVVRCQRAAW